MDAAGTVRRPMTAPESILQVAVPTPVRRRFDYLLPQPGWTSPPVQPGVRVRVPFGRTTAIGVVVGVAATSAIDVARLRRVHEVIDAEPLLDQATLKLLLWASDYFQHPVGEVVAGTLPRLLRLGHAPKAKRSVHYAATAAGERAFAGTPEEEGVGALARAPVQAHLLGLMLAGGSVSETALAAEHREWRRPLRGLIAKGLVEPRDGPPRAAGKAGVTGQTGVDDAAVRPDPNADQQRALDALRASLGTFRPFVLEGVTGSGKTEVYLRVIEEVVAGGRQALVLIPEIGLTPQLLARFQARLPCRVEALHSGLSDGERLSAWARARNGAAEVLVGTRSAVFAPLARPGLFIVDEEHDLSFKQQDGFRYSARDLAVVRARDAGAPIVLGSATPSLEAIDNVRRGRYRLLELPHRAGGASPPRIDVVDLRSRPFDNGLCDVLIEAIEEVKARSEQALLFINRRGYAPRLLCHACGWVADCGRCDAHLVFHHADGRLRCHHCGAERAPIAECPECGSRDVRRLGLGTERVAGALESRIEGLRVARMDRDVTRRRGALEAVLDRVHAGAVDVVVGTQMLAKGHHFPNVTLVAILDADGGLFGLDFRATERMAQLLLQVAGRAGRGDRPGRVLLQTHHPNHPLLRTLVLDGYRKFCEDALDERRRARLPPYASLALVRAEAPQPDAPRAFLADAERRANARPRPGVTVLGPAPAPMERRAGRYRAQLLVDAESRTVMQRFLPEWIAALEALPSARKVRWSVDVDPQEMA